MTLKTILHSLIILIAVIFLLQTDYLKNFIWAATDLFIDFKIPLEWLRCNSLGVNLLTLETLNCGERTVSQFNYGYIFLSLPYNEFLDTIYRNYVPWILVVFIIFLSTFTINPKNKIELFILYLSLLNPSSMLLMERMQLDSLFYLSILLTTYHRVFFVTWILGVFFSLIKFYPVAILATVFLEDKKRSLKKILIILITLLFLIFLYMLINWEGYSFMLNNMLPGKAGYHFLFSLNGLAKIFNYLFEIRYQFFLLITYLFFFYLLKKMISKNYSLYETLKLEVYEPNSNIFVISGYFLVFLFIFVSSYAYKEIYIILLLPFILSFQRKYPNNIFFKNLIKLIILRYAFLFIYGFLNVHDGISFVNGERVFTYYFLIVIFIKSILDWMLMLMIFSILFLKSKIIFSDKILKKI
ncbi:hypothetical protein [Candidatus Pelagibacter sp. RS39]|uniref:hypothetical protein n=1 Tax=Candidatus Pelagibacter sp. RS39 TaxID=1977864 RepID=UPI000A15580E|nr:hypothetical protein [Candidatus Pelagibacter sp. RS39]ARJ47992.1 hypothetical protein B5L73_04190 [Candidatus Pelagibacter sp. RS39]